MQDILTYLAAEYDPVAIIIYGSFSDGTHTLFSDFDALLITSSGTYKHDDRFIDCTQLDVSIYPLSTFQNDYDPAQFTQIYGGQILLDRGGIAQKLLEDVQNCVDAQSCKPLDALALDVDWCEKMLRRAERTDAEGSFHRHLLLVSSLEIYMQLRSWHYLGPNKALSQLRQKDKAAFVIYSNALFQSDYSSVAQWIAYIRERFDRRRKGRKKKK